MHKLDYPQTAVVFEVVGHDRSSMLASDRYGSTAACQHSSSRAAGFGQERPFDHNNCLTERRDQVATVTRQDKLGVNSPQFSRDAGRLWEINQGMSCWDIRGTFERSAKVFLARCALRFLPETHRFIAINCTPMCTIEPVCNQLQFRIRRSW